MAEATASIEIRGVSKIFGPRAAACLPQVRAGLGKSELLDRENHVLGLSNVDLDIESGRVQVVMGLSGSGKSTLIRHINRLIDPTAGRIVVGGIDVLSLNARELLDFRRRMTAMVFQRFALLPHRTVVGNVVFGIELRGPVKVPQIEEARHWISRVGLSGFEDKYPAQLSGGMQQRVGLARALTTNAPILLMDEAFSALDPLIRVDMQEILLELQAEMGKTVVFITHDLDEALRLGDRIAIMHDGELVQDGTPRDIVLRPANAYVESFVRHVDRGRVVRASALARPAGDGAGLPRLPANLSLNETARRLHAAEASEADLVNAAGRIVGRVSLADVIGEIVKR